MADVIHDYPAMNLELLGMQFLRNEKRCMFVINERTPRYQNGTPDVLGVTPARFLLEIEVKRSLSDFKADFSKVHRRLLLAPEEAPNVWQNRPKQFWYLVPTALTPKVIDLVPEWAGLMEAAHGVTVIKPAPTNKLSNKLTIRECCQLAHLLANQVIALKQSADRWRRRFEDGEWWCDSEYQI
jgi:hypothetical protein